MCACMVHAVLLGQSRCSRCLALHTPPAPLCTRPLSAHAPPLYADGPSLLPPPYTSPLCSFPPCPRCWAGPGARGPELYSFQVFVVCLVQSWNSSCVCVCACVRAGIELHPEKPVGWAKPFGAEEEPEVSAAPGTEEEEEEPSDDDEYSDDYDWQVSVTRMCSLTLLLECVLLLCY